MNGNCSKPSRLSTKVGTGQCESMHSTRVLSLNRAFSLCIWSKMEKETPPTFRGGPPPSPPTPAEPPRHTPQSRGSSLAKAESVLLLSILAIDCYQYCYYLFLLLIVTSITLLCFFVLTRRIGGHFHGFSMHVHRFSIQFDTFPYISIVFH